MADKISGRRVDTILLDDISGDDYTSFIIDSLSAYEDLMKHESGIQHHGAGTLTGRLQGKGPMQQSCPPKNSWPMNWGPNPTPDKLKAIPVGLFTSEKGSHLEMPDEFTAPTNTIQDREHLKLSISEYQNFSEAVSKNCFLDRDGNHCKLKNAKTKKLKNLRYKINKSEYLKVSMIWRAQLHVIQMELSKRNAVAQGRF